VHKKHVCYYLPPLSQLRFLFTNELSTSGIVMFCSDQKFINDSHKKSTLKSRSRFKKKKLNRNQSKLRKAVSGPHYVLSYLGCLKESKNISDTDASVSEVIVMVGLL